MNAKAPPEQEPHDDAEQPVAPPPGGLGRGFQLAISVDDTGPRPPQESAIEVDVEIDLDAARADPEPEEIEPEEIEPEDDDEDDGPATERRPAAPRRLRTPTLVLTGDVRSAALPFEPPPRRARVETLVDIEEVKREALPFVPPKQRTPTLVLEGRDAAPALPFHAATDAPITPATPIVRPTIGVELAGAAVPTPPPPRHEEPVIDVAIYAAIKLDIWAKRAPVGEILARHGVDEALFRAHDRSQAGALSDEAKAGRSDLARAVEGALDAAGAVPVDAPDPPCSLDEFVILQIAIDRAAHPSVALAERGVDPTAWRRARRHWRERAAADARVGEEIRARLREARRAADSASLGSLPSLP